MKNNQPIHKNPAPVRVWRKWVDPSLSEGLIHDLEARFFTGISISETSGRKRLRVEIYPRDAEEGRRLCREYGGCLKILKASDWWAPQLRRDPVLKIGSKLMITTDSSQLRRLAIQNPSKLVLSIPEGMAFGTGYHSTTKMCLAALLSKRTSPPSSLLDIGTGSGVIAIAARKLGCPKVDAFDFDPVAVRVARENALLNLGVDRQLTIQRADVSTWPARSKYELVIANLFSGLLIDNAARISRCVGGKGELLLSGIRKDQAAGVLRAFRKLSWRKSELFASRSGWVAILLSRN
jgi:ribosomal protein L11 methyltransferase